MKGELLISVQLFSFRQKRYVEKEKEKENGDRVCNLCKRVQCLYALLYAGSCV